MAGLPDIHPLDNSFQFVSYNHCMVELMILSSEIDIYTTPSIDVISFSLPPSNLPKLIIPIDEPLLVMMP
jgi:hypothetical protein